MRYKDLLYFLVLRDITVLYKQTVFGFAWAIINPLIQILIFSFIFGSIAGIKPDIDGMPYVIFSSLAIIPWTYFSNALNSASTSLIGASGIFTKVYFPRLFIPITPIISKLLDFTISLIILAALMIYFGYYPGINILYLPIPLLIIILTASGLGFWFSSLALQYRDFRFAINFFLPVLMYVAPVAFPTSMVKDKFGEVVYHIYGCYPMVGAIEAFRKAFTYEAEYPWMLISISITASIVIFISGVWYFRKTENYFADIA